MDDKVTDSKITAGKGRENALAVAIGHTNLMSVQTDIKFPKFDLDCPVCSGPHLGENSHSKI